MTTTMKTLVVLGMLAATGEFKSVPKTKCPFDIAYIIETSATVRTAALIEEKTFLTQFMTSMNAGLPSGEENRVALIYITKSHATTIRQLSDTTNANQTIQALTYSPGLSNMLEAFVLVKSEVFTAENGDRADVKNLVVLLSDGTFTDAAMKNATEQIANEPGVIPYTVSFGVDNIRGSYDNNNLKDLSNNVFPMNHASSITNALDDIYLQC